MRNGVVEGSTVIELLDAEVREEVRRSGVDPLVAVETVRRFAQSAVAGHDQRSLSGVVRPVDDPDEVVEEPVARVAGFGPLQRYLDDPRLPFGIRCSHSAWPVGPLSAVTAVAVFGMGGPSPSGVNF